MAQSETVNAALVAFPAAYNRICGYTRPHRVAFSSMNSQPTPDQTNPTAAVAHLALPAHYGSASHLSKHTWYTYPAD